MVVLVAHRGLLEHPVGQARSDASRHRGGPQGLQLGRGGDADAAFATHHFEFGRSAYRPDRGERFGAERVLWRRRPAAGAEPARVRLHAREGLHAQIELSAQTYFSARAKISISPRAKNSRTIPPITAIGTLSASRVASRPAEIGITATTAPKAMHLMPRPASASGVKTRATVRVNGSKPHGEGPYISR